LIDLIYNLSHLKAFSTNKKLLWSRGGADGGVELLDDDVPLLEQLPNRLLLLLGQNFLLDLVGHHLFMVFHQLQNQCHKFNLFNNQTKKYLRINEVQLAPQLLPAHFLSGAVEQPVQRFYIVLVDSPQFLVAQFQLLQNLILLVLHKNY
jgi:hypothetical protein